MSVQLSIIIPFFNRMQYMPQLIESIPVRDEIEIIIVDDKSTQEEATQLKDYVAQMQATRKIAYFYNDGVKSAGACRNVGLRHAIGEWITFADSDDYFVGNLYETVSPWFVKEYDLVYFIPTSVDRATGLETERHRGFADWVNRYLESPSEAEEYRLKGFYIAPWSKIYRASALKGKEIFFDEVRASNDVMFSVKAAFEANSIAASSDVIYCVTKSPGSLIYSVDKEVLDARLTVFIDYYNYLKVRVPKTIFKAFRLQGRTRILPYIAQKQSVFVILGATWNLIVHGVPVFELRLLNPFVLAKAIKGHLGRHKKNKTYYKTHEK